MFLKASSLRNRFENIDDYPGIKSWIGNREIWEKTIGSVNDGGGAAQRRRLGRLLFACAVNEYINIIKNQVVALRVKSGKQEVTFHIISGLAGGTGSGAIVDVIAQTRKHFQERYGVYARYKIFVYCLVPERLPLPCRDAGFYHANGFAALQELNALQVKRFIPHDVSGEYEFVQFENVSEVFNSCFLFTNTDEIGVNIDTKVDLPDMVSDFIFHYLTMNVDDNTIPFIRSYMLEIIADSDKEYDENAKTFEIAYREPPVRTRRFNAFGVKRIVVPEEEIVEYLTFNFVKQALLQSKYNRWSEDFGYRDELKNEDYLYFVNDPTTLNRWMLSEAHLTLSLPILPSEKAQGWPTIQDDWNAVVPYLANDVWGRDKKMSVRELEKLCVERFDMNFRKTGVTDFYKNKDQSRKEYAKEICNEIQHDLFGRWQNGQISIDGIRRLMDTLIAQTEIRSQAFDGIMISLCEKIESIYAAKMENEHKWANMSLFQVTLLKMDERLFSSQTYLLQDLYIKKTALEGLRFAQRFLPVLLNEMQLLNNDVKRFSDMLSKTLDSVEKEISSRFREKQISDGSFRQPIVKYYDSAEIKDFTLKLIHDRQIQNAQSSSIRNAIAAIVGSEKSFAKLNEHATMDSFLGILAKNARESTIQAHNDLAVDKNQKFICVNIVDKLKKQYGSPDKQAELNEFARNVLSGGVFLTFDDNEIAKQLKNNDPSMPDKCFMFKNTLVTIPESPENEDFVNKLIKAFKQSSDGSRNIYIDANSQRKNEITVIHLTSCFSLRMVKEVKYLKERYDLLLNGANSEVARLMLHSEGDGSQFPRVFTLTQTEHKEMRAKMIKDTLPYVLLAYTLGIIQYHDKMDGTGKKAYCIIKVDDFGLPIPVVLGEKITQIINSTLLDKDFCAEIKAGVQAQLAGRHLNIINPEELEAALQKELSATILPECNHHIADPVFIKFKEAIIEATHILKID